jgi:uncharacterized RDD family membrane protein YckC
MTDDQQQPGQPAAGAPGAWPPPQDQTVVQPTAPAPGGWAPPPAGAPAGWAPQQQPPQAWGQPPAYPPQPQPFGQQPGYPPPGYPPQPGYPPAYGQPAYAPTTFGAPQYAGFWIRLVAYIIDSVLLGVVLVVCFLLMFIIIGIPLFFIACFGYFPYFWWKGGATPGMKVLGLRVVRAIDGGPIDGSMAAIRALVFYAESFFAGWLIGLLGFVWAAFEPRKRAWHDMAANTVVIHTN